MAKICPLLMVARGDVLGAGLCNCIEEMCAWYVTHGCAIVYRAYTEGRWNDGENLSTADGSPW